MSAIFKRVKAYGPDQLQLPVENVAAALPFYAAGLRSAPAPAQNVGMLDTDFATQRAAF